MDYCRAQFLFVGFELHTGEICFDEIFKINAIALEKITKRVI